MNQRRHPVAYVVGALLLAAAILASELNGVGWKVESLMRLAIVLLVINACFFTLYFLLSLPFRRAERARLFLDLVDEGARAGHVERFLVRVSQAQETSLGVRFHLLAAWLEKGLPLDEALTKVPRLLPPDLVALLRVGRETGQLPAMLPACRERLRDAGSAVRVAQGRMLMLLCGVLPLQLFVFTLMRVVVWPKFREIGLDMGADLSVLELAMERFVWLWPAVFLLFGVPVLLGGWSHLAGPRAWTWAPVVLPAVGNWLVMKCVWIQRLPEWLALRLPWKRHRLQRDFARVLAQMLDLRLPEERAVRLAAESTANQCFQQRAARVTEALQRGAKLPDALALLNDDGALRWRLDTAARAQSAGTGDAASKTGFQTALAGWITALDAKAFQAEQTAAHLLSAAFVLANGALVALVCTGTMQMLISLIGVAGEW